MTDANGGGSIWREGQELWRQAIPGADHLDSDQAALTVNVEDDHSIGRRALDRALVFGTACLDFAEIDVGGIRRSIISDSHFWSDTSDSAAARAGRCPPSFRLCQVRAHQVAC